MKSAPLRRPFASRAAAALILAAAFAARAGGGEPAVLRAYAGAGLKPALDRLAAAFEARTGTRIEFDYSGSGVLLARAKLDRSADLFIPGDADYVDQLRRETDLVASHRTLGYFTPVILARAAVTPPLRGLADLARPGLKVGLGNAKSCQVGRTSDDLLAAAGLKRAALDAKESLTVNELVVWLKTGDIDAAIVWDALAREPGPELVVVPIPREVNRVSRVEAAVLTHAPRPERAAAFLDFAAGEEGRRALEAGGLGTAAP